MLVPIAKPDVLIIILYFLMSRVSAAVSYPISAEIFVG
jgi:hypothetical protein